HARGAPPLGVPRRRRTLPTLIPGRWPLAREHIPSTSHSVAGHARLSSRNIRGAARPELHVEGNATGAGKFEICADRGKLCIKHRKLSPKARHLCNNRMFNSAHLSDAFVA